MMRRNLLSASFAACLVLVGAQGFAADGSVAAYVDAAGTQCEGNHGGGLMTGSVWANLAGATAGGITGVEFRLDNTNPSDYLISFDAEPGTVYLGNVTLTGGNVAFADCQGGARVKIGTLSILELSPAMDATFTVRQRFEPTHADFQCVRAVLCDAPVYSSVCVGAPNSDHWRAVVNPSDGVSGDCFPVAVEATSWSAVKGLFQN
jgi:hypothetical protein